MPDLDGLGGEKGQGFARHAEAAAGDLAYGALLVQLVPTRALQVMRLAPATLCGVQASADRSRLLVREHRIASGADHD